MTAWIPPRQPPGRRQDFKATLAGSEAGYRELWRSMFTPGNRHFSGHLPTLRTPDPGLREVVLHGRAAGSVHAEHPRQRAEPVFLTGGPRLGPTTTYFWDHTEWSRLYALLEPAGMRSWLHRALSSPYDQCFGFDTRNGGPLGNEYAANDYALFRLVEHYVCITGDRAFLDEQAGSLTVIGHLERLAHGWRARRTEATGGVLADFGADPWTLLECVPNYVNVVASFNAAYAGMTRSYAGLLRALGHAEEAAAADAEADKLATAVVGMSLPDGRWQIRHPARTESIGHCLDFGLVAAHLHADLSEDQRAAGARFAGGETSRLYLDACAGARRPGSSILRPARPRRCRGILRLARHHRARTREARAQGPGRGFAQRRARFRVRRPLGTGNGNRGGRSRPASAGS